VASCRFRVCGRVQGVGYRYFALRTAMQLGVGGFARNLDDGSVEVLAEGSPESLTRFEEALRRGPSFAEVQAVERSASPPRGDADFHIR